MADHIDEFETLSLDSLRQHLRQVDPHLEGTFIGLLDADPGHLFHYLDERPLP